MRTLFILRGAPASGKSTWIQQNNLEPYTISTDTLRLMYQSPVTDKTGERAISQNHDTEVWKLLMELLERRMDNGEFVIIDATHYKSSLITKYKDLVDKYRYRVCVVDFTKISEEELKERNAKRGFRKVPEEVIEKMVVALADDSEVKKAYKIITPEEASNMIYSRLQPVVVDSSKVVVFGDIHGCYDPLKAYFEANPFSEDTCYIFTGDYLDRGPQNKEVLDFLISIYKKPNVVLLEGNHEKWLRIFAEKGYDMEFYESRPTEYKDPFVTKVISQLKDRLVRTEKKIKKNNNKSEELSALLREAWEENPEAKEVYYEFELVNVKQVQKELHEENKKLEKELEDLRSSISVLKHEEWNTDVTIKAIKERFAEFGISLDITNILEKNYSVKANRSENPIRSLEFIKRTYPQIKDVDKAEVRQLCRKFAQMSYFQFRTHNFLVTHGGVPDMPTLLTQTIELIKGVGKYEDHQDIDKQFVENTERNVIAIHGHRNTLKVPITNENGFAYNLEGDIEHGGCLRILEITGWDENSLEIHPIEIKNNNFIEDEKEEVKAKTDLELLKEMYHSPLVQVKKLNDNVLSLNFTRDAFQSSKWNELTTKARGLFVNKTNGEVVARSYDKFFNHREVDSTTTAGLKENFKFPVVGYKKENGFLGIVSKYKGKIKFFTKSSDEGDYVNWFIGVLCDNYDIHIEKDDENKTRVSYSSLYNAVEKLKSSLSLAQKKTPEDENKIKELQSLITINTNLLKLLIDDYLIPHLNLLLEEGYSYVFECVDKDNDPHIIKYDSSEVVLLEVFKNQMKQETLSYDKLVDIAKLLSVRVKQPELKFDSWDEFEAWKKDFTEGVNSWNCKHEGYVFEDSEGFRVKFKSRFYKFWKQMRAVKESIQAGRANKKIYKTKEEIQIVKLLEGIDKGELKKMSIIDIEDKFYENYGG